MRRVRLDNLNNKCWHFNVCCHLSDTNKYITYCVGHLFLK
jgi:hypothetical protein